MVDPVQLPAYLERLANEPQFKGRRFAHVEIKALDGGPGGDTAQAALSEFQLKASVRPDVAASEALQP